MTKSHDSEKVRCLNKAQSPNFSLFQQPPRETSSHYWISQAVRMDFRFRFGARSCAVSKHCMTKKNNNEKKRAKLNYPRRLRHNNAIDSHSKYGSRTIHAVLKWLVAGASSCSSQRRRNFHNATWKIIEIENSLLHNWLTGIIYKSSLSIGNWIIVGRKVFSRIWMFSLEP